MSSGDRFSAKKIALTESAQLQIKIREGIPQKCNDIIVTGWFVSKLLYFGLVRYLVGGRGSVLEVIGEFGVIVVYGGENVKEGLSKDWVGEQILTKLAYCLYYNFILRF